EIVLKMCLSAFTFAWFLTGRFKERLPFVFTVSLSVGYSLMQYVLHQGNANVGYLDGVYMLPLMMLGVYYVIESGVMHFLAITTGLAIIFNWYIAGVNCVFSGVYFLTELLLFVINKKKHNLWNSLPEKAEVGDSMPNIAGSEVGDSTRNGDISGSLSRMVFGRAGRYIVCMLTGVLLSAFLFLPTIFELKLGKADGMDWYLFGWGLRGNPLELVHNYYPGSGLLWSGMAPTVFCGSLALTGALGVFSVKKTAISLKEKLVYGAFIIVMALMIYWKPLYLLFSLFKEGTGHTGRYLYLGCFMLLYVAAVFFSELKDVNRKLFVSLVCAWLILFILLIVREPVEVEYAGVTACLSIIVFTVLVLIYSRVVYGKTYASEKHLFKKETVIISAAIVILCCIEGGYNARIVLENYTGADNAKFESYETEGQRLIDSLKEYDGGYYRITQTMNRDMTMSGTTANYNEAFGFGYASIGGYTSTQHSAQLDFLESGGYRNEDATPTVVSNTPVIPLDSLLGVRYVLSPYEIRGYKKIDEIENGDGKDVYLNPYALPIMFKVEASEASVTSSDGKGAADVPAGSDISDDSEEKDQKEPDPFEYNNRLFEYLTGIAGNGSTLFSPVEFEIKDSGETRRYEVQAPSGDFALYGYLPWTERVWGGADIDINGVINMPFSRWNSLDLFYIPRGKEGRDDGSAYVELKGYDPEMLKDEAFYTLDLNKLSKLSSMLKTGEPELMEIENGRVSAKVSSAEEGEKLFMSIPYDAGWDIKINGERILPEIFEDCFIMIPLKEGENEISMEYHIPWFTAGLALTFTGILITLFMLLSLRKRDQYRALPGDH
ncbi:MAG: YfhO family protein, partial [Lachnospiraceae bacterium]|nr:YfhO family protein [Lachnospiraceae bacterium]